MTNTSIYWLDGTATATLRCPVCDSHSARELLSLTHKGKPLTFLRCQHCESIFPQVKPDSESLGGYSPGQTQIDGGVKHYIEIGAGIEALTEPLLVVNKDVSGSLLDVGCGFGFVVDYWSKWQPGRSHGIELASYGYWGQELLRADISHELLNCNSKVQGKKFDNVFSAEVIEHVSEPGAFLGELFSHVSPDGVLTITTPNAGAITQAFSEPYIIANLSPGAHEFVLSEKALVDLIERSLGNVWVKVKADGIRLIAWIARHPIELFEEDSRTRTQEKARLYYEQLSLHSNAWIQGGGRYRAFREAVNHGDYKAAAAMLAGLRQLLKSDPGIDINLPSQLAELVEKILQPEGLLRTLPCYLGPLMYYCGMLALNHQNAPSLAALYFEASVQINLHWVKTSPGLAQEASTLLAPGLFHHELALERALDRANGYKQQVFSADPNGATTFASRFVTDLHGLRD
jgi:SAM-dependent methyltransferase